MNFLRRFVDIKLLKFVIVGVVNTLVGSAIMYGLYNLAGVDYWVSSAANYGLTSVLSFFLNKHFTFQYKQNDWKSVARFALNIVVCWLVAYGAAKPVVSFALEGLFGGTTRATQENISMLAGQVLFVGLNYFGQRFFAFKATGEKENGEGER